jgi:hypothetical protein
MTLRRRDRTRLRKGTAKCCQGVQASQRPSNGGPAGQLIANLRIFLWVSSFAAQSPDLTRDTKRGSCGSQLLQPECLKQPVRSFYPGFNWPTIVKRRSAVVSGIVPLDVEIGEAALLALSR